MKRLPHDSLAQVGFFREKEPVPRICKPVPFLFLESIRAASKNYFCPPRSVTPDEAARRHRHLRPLGRSVSGPRGYWGADHLPALRAFAGAFRCFSSGGLRFRNEAALWTAWSRRLRIHCHRRRYRRWIPLGLRLRPLRRWPLPPR